MESLVEEVEALVAPDLSTSTPDWCENCQMLRKDIQRLQEEQGQNFGKLKQKIISTDLLIKKYKAKCEDYDLLCKKMDEVNKKAEKHMRQNSILETQLKAALLDVDPLRKSKAALETEVKEQSTRIQDLTDKVVAFEWRNKLKANGLNEGAKALLIKGTQKQYEYLTKTSSADIEKLDAERKELLNKVKALEAGKVTKEAAKEYKVEISSLKKENHILAGSEKKLDKKLKAALLKIDSLTLALKEAKSSPGRGRRRSSNSRMSPVKSPVRSSSHHSPTKSPLRRTPKGRGVGVKSSPPNTHRARTLSGREITVTDGDGIDSDSSVGSVRSDYSSRWIFSPLAKCLSPLPPSPACFSNRKEPESDDGVVSDIADELEQQLAEGFGSSPETDEELEDQLEDPLQTKPPVLTGSVEVEDEDKDKETGRKESDEIKEGVDLFDLNEYEIPDVESKIENTETSKQSAMTSLNKDGINTAESLATIQGLEKDIHDYSEHSVTCKTDELNGRTELDIEDSNKNESLDTSFHSEIDHRVKVKRIAHSSKCNEEKQKLEATKNDTEIVKTMHVLSHTVKMPVTTENKATEKDRIGSQNEALENKPEQEDGNTQDEKMKQLPRNDTSEFVPVLDGHLETLSDSDTDSKACTETNGDILDCKGDASTVDRKQEFAGSAEAEEVDMKVEEQVEEVERHYPPNRGTLRRQQNISGEGTHTWKSTGSTQKVGNKVKTVKATSDSTSSCQKNKKGMKGKSKYGPHSFIAFKQSSSGTLADELENLSNEVDYVCNDRSEITTQKNEIILENKNVDITKVKIKKLRKYKDLDNIHDDISSEFGTAHSKIEGKKGPDMLEEQFVERDLQEEMVVPDCDKDVSLCVTRDNAKDEDSNKEKYDKGDIVKLANKGFSESVGIQPNEKTVISRTKSHEIYETDSKVLRSQKQSSIDSSNTAVTDLAIHKDTFNDFTEEKNETNDTICDKDNVNTQGEIKESVSDSNIDTEKVQTSRQLSTGFVVNSPYSDRLSESPSPSNFLDKDKLDKRKSKLKGSSLCDTVLEQIQEEDSPKDSSEEDISTSDISTVHNTKITHEIIKPGCSFHYNENEENFDDLSSSLSLSEEIEKIMDKKSTLNVTRVISCTPDMLDSESGEIPESVSRTESPSGDSIERKSPLSPLPISPFDFIIPISPLPPSPVNEIDRVSPLSPDNFDSQVDNTELEQNISEVHSGSREVLQKPKLTHTVIEDFNFSIPGALSPIKTPEHKKCNSKLNKSKSSAFKNVSSFDNQSVDSSKLGYSAVVKEKTTDQNEQKYSALISEQAEAPQKQLSKKAMKRLKKKQRDKEKELVAKNLNENCVNNSTETNSYLEPEVSTHSNPELMMKPPSDDDKSSIISEKENQTQNIDKTESAPDVVNTDLDVPTGHDNLVAVKKKTRLAHKPNIQTLKPQKIQIIEAPALSMVAGGRKRRSLDSGDKDGQEKKQCKTQAFQKQKLVNKNLALSKEETKKMQMFLKSVELPDSFVTKVTETGDTGVSRLLDSCIECLGRIQTDTTEVVYQQCLTDAYCSLHLQWPFMSDVEKQATKLLKYLYSQTHLNISYKDVMMRLWEAIFGRNIRINVVGQMCFSRVFTALSSLEGDVEQARVLFYHIVACGHLIVRQFVVSVVSVWPEVLKKSEFDRPDKAFSHSLVLVLEEVVTRTLLSEELEVNKKVLLILQKLCGWKGCCGDTEIILRTLLQRLAEIPTNKPDSEDMVFEIVKAVHILAVTGGWPWFKEFFIMRHGLQPITTKYLAKSANKPVSPACVKAVLRITGSVTQALSASVPVKEIDHFTKFWMFPLINTKDGDDIEGHGPLVMTCGCLRQTFRSFLLYFRTALSIHLSESDPEISKCCVEVLLELSALQPSILKGVNSWFITQTAPVQNEHRRKLETIRKQYQSKHNLVCDSFL